MNYITEHISADRIIGSENEQFIQEGEVLLPDDKPDIDIVLRCEASIVPEESRADENRLSFSGKLVINILYCGKDKSVHSVSAEVPINDFITIDGAQSGMLSHINADISNIECKKVNERKASYKIMCEIRGSVSDTAEIEAVTDIYDIPKEQQLSKTINTTRTLCLKRENFTVTEETELPATKLPVSEVLNVSCSITNPEFKPRDDSIEARGDISVVMLYTSTEGNFPEVYEFDIPFDVSLEADATDNDSIADVNLYVRECYYDITENSEGEAKTVNMDVNIGADIHTLCSESHNILSDAYMLNNDIVFDETKLCYSNVVCKNRGQCPVKEVVSLADGCPNMLQIFRASGTVYTDEINIYDNRVVLEGAVNVDIMYITGNDDMPVYSFSDSVPFTQTIDARGAKEGMEAEVYASIAHIGFNMLSDRELEVRCALNTVTTVRDKSCISIITGAELKPILQEVIDAIPGITLYVVKKGDTLWKLARRFNTTVKEIARINDIENPDLIYPNQKLVIVKNV